MVLLLKYSNIGLQTEEVDYEQCAGDALRKCIIGGENGLEQKVDQNFLTAMEKYVNCYENEGKTCKADILQHFIAHLRVYRQHLEENHAAYGKVVKKIPLPP